MQFNLADIFETVAGSVPDRVALTYEGENFSYSQLDAEANRTANLFAQAGISSGDHVALFLKNSVEHVTSILGLIKIRAVPINVNYRYTPAELEYIFTNSDSVAVVVELPEHQRVLASLFGACPKVKTVIVIGEIDAELVAAAKAHEVSVVSFDDAREQSPVGSSTLVLATTCTSSTPAGPPDTRRASCGVMTTSSVSRSPAAIRTVRERDRTSPRLPVLQRNFRNFRSSLQPR